MILAFKKIFFVILTSLSSLLTLLLALLELFSAVFTSVTEVLTAFATVYTWFSELITLVCVYIYIVFWVFILRVKSF